MEGASHGLEFCLAKEADFEQVMSISEDVYDGIDYMPARYHAWLKEPDRRVILAKRKGQVEILPLCFELEEIRPKLDSAISQLKTCGAEWEDPILLQASDVQRVFLNPNVVGGVLPGKTIVQDCAAYRPLQSNLEILLKKNLIWLADGKEEPRVLSLGANPYRIPMGADYKRFSVNIFGKHFPGARNQFLAQLQRGIGTLQGSLYCVMSLEPCLWQQMHSFCQSSLGLHQERDFEGQMVLEKDMSTGRRAQSHKGGGFKPHPDDEILPLRFELEEIRPKLDSAISQLKTCGEEWEDPILLQASDVQRVFLNPNVVGGVLPGKTIVQDCAPYRPLQSNLEILLKKNLIWLADGKEEPRVLSLGATPYRIPMGAEFNRLNIDIFGKHFPCARNQFLAQLQRGIGTLQGSLYCVMSLEPCLWQQMYLFCQSSLGLHQERDFEGQMVLENDMSTGRRAQSHKGGGFKPHPDDVSA
ncbi:histidine N-acetyltransferase-like isoform X2 [Scyliorhinus torazame]|uniref:histidine N-acetyltransferase-like isoform X2 n=1 Tax=Scyliorhinus torazame TaxID=75743 RepID=UPI003B5911DF